MASTNLRLCVVVALFCAAWLGGCESDSSGSKADAANTTDAAGTISDAGGADIAANSDVGGADIAANSDVGGADIAANSDTGGADIAANPDTDGPAADSVGANDTAPGNAPQEEWVKCSASSQCAVFETLCCDHCNGGKMLAANKKHLDAASKALAKPKAECAGVACTEMACASGIAICTDGKCVAGSDPAWPAGCAKLSETDCKASPKCAPMMAYNKADICGNAPKPVKKYEGCMNSDGACGCALTCASKAAKLVVFPSTCLPEGFKAEKYEKCCPP